MKVFFYTLGCKVNHYESQEMGEELERRGFTVVTDPRDADAVVVNSCAVTAESVRKTRQAARRFRKLNPGAVLAVTGCATQTEPEKLSELGVDVLLGNRTNGDLAEALQTAAEHKVVDLRPHETGEAYGGTGITRFDGHTRAFLKIQDGCDRFCSYCLIPYARGRSRSKDPLEIDRELAALAANGYREIVFVGIDLSDYGKGETFTLPDALRLAEAYDGIARVRLGSLEPHSMTDALIAELAKLPKLCPHFHISAQSGSDRVLKAMNRHYTAAEFLRLCETLRTAFPDCALTTDMIAGFPTETEEDLRASADFIRAAGFEKTHVFPYSAREGTPAAKLPQLTAAEKDRRAALLTAVAEEVRSEYLHKQIGKTVEVLFEAEPHGVSQGYTAAYTPVCVADGKSRTGSLCSVRITGVKDDGCTGEAMPV